MNLAALKKAPFRLDDRALAWVQETFAVLTPAEKLGQLVVPLALDTSRENLDRFLALGVGGLFRRTMAPLAQLRAEADYLRRQSRVPLLMCGDLEFSETGAIGGAEGVSFPNQMAVAATDDPRFAATMARIAAREGRAAGYNWSLTPVVDLDLNAFNPAVNTRSFGDNASRVARFAAAYVTALQAKGVAACAKHWPGDGVDDRNQHFVTSVNSCELADWEKTFGRVYRAVIREGVLSIMSGHIALPAFPGAGLCPASISRELNFDLLRGRLRYNGLILSDASVMAGLTSQGTRAELVPRSIEHGCDMVLFTDDLELDLDYLVRARSDGRLSARRIDEAVLRVLGLKATLGLHRAAVRSSPVRALSPACAREHLRATRACAARAVTLVKDEPGRLPLSPVKHRRVLLIQPPLRQSPRSLQPALRIGQLLADTGFTVENYSAETEVHRDHFDVVIYVVADEGHALKTSQHLDWKELHGDWRRSMERYWHDVPVVFISLGTPHHLRELPACPTVINAYSPVPAMQEAVVQALVGQIPFRGVSPVDLTDAEFGRLQK